MNVDIKLMYLAELTHLLSVVDVVGGTQDYQWTMMRIKRICESIERDIGIANGAKSNVGPVLTALLGGAGEAVERRDGAPQE